MNVFPIITSQNPKKPKDLVKPTPISFVFTPVLVAEVDGDPFSYDYESDLFHEIHNFPQ